MSKHWLSWYLGCDLQGFEFKSFQSLPDSKRTSPVVQWLRIHLPMQGTQVQSLVREDPTRQRAAKPVHHSCWAKEPVVSNKRSHRSENPVPRNWRRPYYLQVGKACMQQQPPTATKQITTTKKDSKKAESFILKSEYKLWCSYSLLKTSVKCYHVLLFWLTVNSSGEGWGEEGKNNPEWGPTLGNKLFKRWNLL